MRPHGHMHPGTDACIPGSEHRRGTPVLACSDIPDGNQTTTTPSVEVRRPAPTWFRICVPPQSAHVPRLEGSLHGPSADVVVTLHEPTYVLEVATYGYDRRRLGARQAKHCLQPYSSVSVTLVKNTREKENKTKGLNTKATRTRRPSSHFRPVRKATSERSHRHLPFARRPGVFASAVESVICPSVE